MKKGNIVLFYPDYQGMGTYHWFPFPYLYLGPFLEKEGFKVRIIDARVELAWRELLKESLSDALCIGITAMTGSDINASLEAAEIARSVNLNLPIIWGGPHATALPEETVKSEYIDIVVRGQGEIAMTEIANSLYNKEDISSIKGIAYKDKGTVYLNPSQALLPFDYDIFPGFDLVDIEKYRSPNNIVSVFTSRGCPFKCTFCTTGDKGYSKRTPEQFKKEISYLVDKLKFKNIFFQDGTFFVKKSDVMDIAHWIVESDLNIKWKAKARANSLFSYSKEELLFLKKSGLVSVFFGIESGSERILDKMQKHTKPQDAEKSAEICRDYDFEFYTSFMFAVPGETLDDFRQTISHIHRLKKINPAIVTQNCIYIPLPNTPMYDEACSYGYVPPNTLKGWAIRNISSRFQERTDITWIPKNTLKEYISIYKDEFGEYKHLFEREKEGAYKSVFKKEKKDKSN